MAPFSSFSFFLHSSAPNNSLPSARRNLTSELREHKKRMVWKYYMWWTVWNEPWGWLSSWNTTMSCGSLSRSARLVTSCPVSLFTLYTASFSRSVQYTRSCTRDQRKDRRKSAACDVYSWPGLGAKTWKTHNHEVIIRRSSGATWRVQPWML